MPMRMRVVLARLLVLLLLVAFWTALVLLVWRAS